MTVITVATTNGTFKVHVEKVESLDDGDVRAACNEVLNNLSQATITANLAVGDGGKKYLADIAVILPLRNTSADKKK